MVMYNEVDIHHKLKVLGYWSRAKISDSFLVISLNKMQLIIYTVQFERVVISLKNTRTGQSFLVWKWKIPKNYADCVYDNNIKSQVKS